MCWLISSLIHLAPEGRHVYSTRNATNPKAPAGQHALWKMGNIRRNWLIFVGFQGSHSTQPTTIVERKSGKRDSFNTDRLYRREQRSLFPTTYVMVIT